MSGVYYAFGAGVCKYLHKFNKDVSCSVETTPGGAYSINLLRNHDINFLIVEKSWADMAYSGDGLFKNFGKMENIRAVANLFYTDLAVVVRGSSNIKTVKDIIGKRINYGIYGTSNRAFAEAIIEGAGWDKSDFQLLSELRNIDQAQALCDDKIDVMLVVMNHPNGLVQEAIATCDARVISIDDSIIDMITNKLNSFEKRVIDKSKYKSYTDIDTIGVLSIAVTTSDIDPSLVWSYVNTIYYFDTEISSAHRALSDSYNAKNIFPTGKIPVHESALEFYKKVGIGGM